MLSNKHKVGIHRINEYKLLCLLMCVFIFFCFVDIKYVEKSNSLDIEILTCKILLDFFPFYCKHVCGMLDNKFIIILKNVLNIFLHFKLVC